MNYFQIYPTSQLKMLKYTYTEYISPCNRSIIIIIIIIKEFCGVL